MVRVQAPQHMETEEQIEEKLHVSWFIIAYKLTFGIVEFLSGLSIILFSKNLLLLYTNLVSRELYEDPHDLLARMTEQFIPNLLTHHSYIIFYLMVLGAAKIAGAVGLIFKQYWGVDLLVALTFIMFPFQFIRLAMHPSIMDGLYILVGLFIALYLINYKPVSWSKRIVKRIKKQT